MIHICYSIYDKNGTYAKILGTSLCSLFENTKRYLTVHIMHDETLSQDNADKLLKLARSYGQIMLFHNVDMSEKSSSYEIMRKSSFTIAAFYRLLLPEVLSDDIKKIIYLDADTIVNLDIVDLWEESLDIGGKDAIIGAVADSGMIGVKRNKNAISNGYFNVGVLVLNLDAIRNMGCNYMLEMADKLFTIHQDWPYLDQDLLNYIFADECKFLPERYNHFSKIPYDKKYDSPLKIRMICHYIYIHLQTDTNNPFDYLFWHYFQKTPWCDASFIMNAFNMGYVLMERQTDFLRRFWLSIYKKSKRIYCGNKASENSIKTVCPFDSKDEYWYIEDEKVFQSNLKALQGNKDVVVVFFISNYQAYSQYMMRLGFREENDFFDGRCLFKPKEGGRYFADKDELIYKYIMSI